MARHIVTVFGGSGFVGRHLVKRMVKRGYTVRVAVRDVEAALYLKPLGDAGQIVPWPCDVLKAGDIARALVGASAAVNLVGILYESGRQRFEVVHVEAAKAIAEAAAAEGIRSFVHMSALGADPDAEADYARTKGRGEQAVFEALPEAVVVRPSVIFGSEDKFFNQFARISRISPCLPVLGARLDPKGGFDGGPKFQPVYVGDVAEAIATALENPNACGRSFELGGPAVYSFKEILQLVMAVTGGKRILVPVPFIVATIKAAFLGLLPKPPLTIDQVRLLRHDNVLTGELPGLGELGIEAQTVEAIVPTYLARDRGLRQNKRYA